MSLVRKLVSVLESIEKLQVYNYDSTGTVSGLQVRMDRDCDVPAAGCYRVIVGGVRAAMAS